MKIHFRIDDSNETHSRFTVFVAGKHCGQLCMGTDEIVHFFMIFREGLSTGPPTNDEYRETGKLWETPR